MCYRHVYKLCVTYRLDPSTLCHFDMVYRHYISLKLAKLFETCSVTSVGQEMPEQAERQIKVLLTDALLCLRLAMKMKETQPELYRRPLQDTASGESTFVF
jgi:hypothetical protein